VGKDTNIIDPDMIDHLEYDVLAFATYWQFNDGLIYDIQIFALDIDFSCRVDYFVSSRPPTIPMTAIHHESYAQRICILRDLTYPSS